MDIDSLGYEIIEYYWILNKYRYKYKYSSDINWIDVQQNVVLFFKLSRNKNDIWVSKTDIRVKKKLDLDNYLNSFLYRLPNLKLYMCIHYKLSIYSCMRVLYIYIYIWIISNPFTTLQQNLLLYDHLNSRCKALHASRLPGRMGSKWTMID